MKYLLLAGSVAALLAAGPALAQQPASKPSRPVLPPDSALPPASSPDVVVNLLKLLVQQKVITQVQADGLVRQAQQQAAAARAAPPAAKTSDITIGQGPAPAPGSAAPPPVHVQYVPDLVKQQLRDEIKQEVLQTAKAENWAQPNALPDWVSRIKLSGDFRLRDEQDMFGGNNYNGIVDFNTINGGSPYDVGPGNTSLPPVLNTTEDRERVRIRARLGATIDVADQFTAMVRLSTGSDTNPVSPNQTLGADFNKYNIAVDRAYLNYHPDDNVSLWFGRFDDPFFTSDLIWYDELGFDGVAGRVTYPLADGLSSYLTAGAFPIENTTFDFPSTSVSKVPSHDKFLYAAQAGADWQALPDLRAKFGVAYYHFQNVEGEFSSPCVVNTSSDSCSSDLTRPGDSVKGNTMFALRNIVTSAATTVPYEPEYFGLASAFDILELREQLDFNDYAPVHVIVDADYAVNLGFDAAHIRSLDPVNTYGGGLGNQAFMTKITVGYPHIQERWDWNGAIGYKYLESDAVLDAFNDPDFHLGGTNAKGYTLAGNLGVAHNVWLDARWFSTTEVTGPPLAIDVLQLDLNARF